MMVPRGWRPAIGDRVVVVRDRRAGVVVDVINVGDERWYEVEYSVPAGAQAPTPPRGYHTLPELKPG
jgi:hypothetical protein